MTPTPKFKTVQVRRELLANARTVAPMMTFAAITNAALELWIATEKAKKAAGDEQPTT